MRVQPKGDGSGQAKGRLTENQVFHLTFAPQQSNPTDDDGNPLDLLGGALTFDFRTATLPQIDFYASTIGGKKISTVATDSGDTNRYKLPGHISNNNAVHVDDVSTVLDLKLAFTKPMSLASLSDSLVTLTGEQHMPFVDGSTDPATSGNGISFRLGDLEGGGHPMSSLFAVSMLSDAGG